MPSTDDATRLLAALSEGDRSAFDKLFALVYEELRGIAHRQLQNEREGHTLDTTDLVHEAYFSLVALDRITWSDRAHFLAVAARAMRRLLINHAVARVAQKRGGPSRQQVSLDPDALPSPLPDEDLLALDEALSRLERRSERYGRVVECRFFVGMSVEETAAVLRVSPATVKRDWEIARAWLHRELSA